MSPEELQQVHTDLQVVPQQAADVATTQLGQQQAAQGTLAAEMGLSGGNGIGSYTYNRIVQPTVDSLTQQLVVSGQQAVLNKILQDRLQAAENDYYSAQRNSYNNAAGATGDTRLAGFDLNSVDGKHTRLTPGLDLKDYKWWVGQDGNVWVDTGDGMVANAGPRRDSGMEGISLTNAGDWLIDSNRIQQ